MKELKYVVVLLVACFSCIFCKKTEVPTEIKDKEEEKPEVVIPVVESIKPSIQVDPEFRYYKDRSVASIVDEVVVNGYQVVHYFVTNENLINAEFIEALHKAGVEVWLMTLGNGTYSTTNYPAGWQDWKMTLQGAVNGASGFTFLSPFNADFVAWKKQKLVELVTKYPFDGIELAEAYLPAWGGVSGSNYGDVGPNAAKAFKEVYGLDIPDFKNSSAADYYTKVPATYSKWMKFRANGVNQFLHEIYNGEGGIREKRPDIKVATWSLGIDAGENSIGLLYESQGLDIPAMIEFVKPDLHYVQTHWPDWLKDEQSLPPHYVRLYEAFLREVKAVDPDLPVGIQADIGSAKSMIKSKSWFEKFAEYSRKAGFSTFTAYEYHLGGYIYDELPQVLKATRIADDCLQLSFNKRIRLEGDDWGSYFRFMQNQQEFDAGLNKVEVDGNLIRLFMKQQPDESYTVQVDGIVDTPDLWLHGGFSANEIEAGSLVEVNAK